MSHLICYVTDAQGAIETHTFETHNVNHQKELLLLLHEIANGLQRGRKITFYKE